MRVLWALCKGAVKAVVFSVVIMPPLFLGMILMLGGDERLFNKVLDSRLGAWFVA